MIRSDQGGREEKDLSDRLKKSHFKTASRVAGDIFRMEYILYGEVNAYEACYNDEPGLYHHRKWFVFRIAEIIPMVRRPVDCLYRETRQERYDEYYEDRYRVQEKRY